MTRYTLYRLTVHPSPGAPLLTTLRGPNARTPQAILREAILEQPEGGLRRWRIRDVTEPESGALAFRFGRSGSARSVPIATPSGGFEREEIEVAPFADVVLDLELEVCAISYEHDLGTNTDSVAKRLARTLSGGKVARDNEVVFEAEFVREPTTFLTRLQEAFAVRSLWVTTPRPNPFDSNEQFVKPTAKVVEELGADDAQTTWRGKSLRVRSDAVKDIVRSTAALGGDAGAMVRETEDSRRAVPIKLGKERKTIQVPVPASAAKLLEMLREAYRRVRNH